MLETEVEAEELEQELNEKVARTSRSLAPSRASVIQTPIVEDEIVPEP
jgi:hypothetical protein